MTTHLQGQRFVVRPWWARWAVFDEAETRGEPLAIYLDAIEAVGDAAKRNKAEGARR